ADLRADHCPARVGPPTRRRRGSCMTRTRLGGALALCAWRAISPGFAQGRPHTLVMPFENVTRDSQIFWLTEASAVLMADDLNALGADAITRDERRRAFEQLQVPPVASLTDATVIRIGQLVGASE